MFRKIAMALAWTVVAAGVVTVFASSPAPNYSETFDGNPASPLSWNGMDFDVQKHIRSAAEVSNPESVLAQHGIDCSAPPATHLVNTYDDLIFQCSNHIMTTLNASDYGVIYFTPDQILNFQNGGSVTFDISTERMSVRDWIDVTISPWNQNIALPLLSDLSQGVDLQGPQKNAIHIATDNGEGSPVLKTVENGNVTSWQPGWAVASLNAGISGSVNQAASRQTFKLSISNGHLIFERLASTTAPYRKFWDVVYTPNFTSGVVQFGHHSYTPGKDGAGTPATWHWDSINISPSQEFTILKTTPERLTSGTITFPPAPNGSFLRFSALGTVSVNGQARTSIETIIDNGHFSSYWIPIAQGSTSAIVQTVGTSATGGKSLFKDAYIWSLSTSTPPSTSTPSATATATNTTVIVATNTPTATSTNTPIPTATNTIAPTNTPTSVPTATPTGKPWWCRWFPRWCR